MTDGGKKVFTNVEDLVFLPIQVHFDEKSLATIIAFKDMANLPRVRITMDTAVERAIIFNLANVLA